MLGNITTLKPVRLWPYLLLLTILLIAYLPVSTLYFGMKNDAFSDNFPNKYFFSEALHAGFLPLWNPYLNFGFPIYADPGFAFWNPITWFFGGVIGYNAYTLTIEVLLYIYIAGITMYALGKYLQFSTLIAFTVAAMYMCSGFFIGEIQHINFLTSAAFLPFLLQRFLALCNNPNIKNASITAISYYSVFVGGHPAIPIGVIYFIFVLSASLFLLNKEYRQNWKSLLQYHLIAVGLFIILYAPALYSYVSILGDYGRGVPVDQITNGDLESGFTPASYLSFVYPFATTSNSTLFYDDFLMRNIYFSLLGFLLLLTQLSNKNHLSRSLLLSAFVMIVLSMGGYMKVFLYSNLPLLKYIRSNGEFRVFGILCFCILAGRGLSALTSQYSKDYITYRKLLKILLVSNVLLFIYNMKSVIALLYLIFNIQISVSGIKKLLDSFTFSNSFVISIIISTGLIILLLTSKYNIKKLSFIIIIDLIINGLTYLPFSGVGTITLTEIQDIYKTKNGIPIPKLIQVRNIDTLSSKKTGLVGSLSYYNKQIGTTKLTSYPSYFTNTNIYFNSTLLDTVNNLPYLFLKKDVKKYLADNEYYNNNLRVVSFSPQKITINVNAITDDSIVFLQNHYKFWKAKVDGEETPLDKSLITFMSVPLKSGVHTVAFYYQDKWLYFFIALSITSFLVIGVLYFNKIEKP